MEFTVSLAQRELQERARRLAADFATRAAQHDRDASDPVENYAALRDAGFFGLNVPAELGGGGVGLLGWSLAAEELAQGCGSTALSFNMHLSVVGPMMESPLVPRATKERLAKMVAAGLTAEGYAVDLAHDGRTGLSMARIGDYDAIILDIMLPAMNGFQVCATLRQEGVATPILMLTAKDGEYDEAEGLDTGADDYLTKPFSFVVLQARLRAMMRRGRSAEHCQKHQQAG